MININVVFNYKKKLNSKKEGLIHIRINENSEVKYISTDIKVSEKQFDYDKKTIKNHDQAISFNKKISDILRKLSEIQNKFILQDKFINPEILKNEFFKKPVENEAIEFFKKTIALKEDGATKNNYKVCINKIEAYKKNLFFKDINYEFLMDFVNYLKISSLHINTIFKTIRQFHYLYKEAEKQDLTQTKDPFVKLDLKKEITHRDFFNTNDFLKILNFQLDFENLHLQDVFDRVLLALYSGLRISDINSLLVSDIKLTDDGFDIDKKMKKTGRFVKIPVSLIYNLLDIEVKNTLPDLIKRILKNKSSQDLVFKTLLPYTLYKKVSELYKLIGVENLKFHSCRHTFAMYLINESGLSIEVISKLLGHTDIKTTKIYSSLSDAGLKNQLKIAFNKNKEVMVQNKKGT